MRLVDQPDELDRLLGQNAPSEQMGKGERTFSADEWLANPCNVAVAINDDLAMFEHLQGSEYRGHVMFASRGREAIENGQKLIAFMVERMGASVIFGSVPAWRKDVLCYVRKLGFLPVGESEEDWGDGEKRPVVIVRLNGNISKARLVA